MARRRIDRRTSALPSAVQVADAGELRQMRASLEEVEVARDAVAILAATRDHPKLVLGASPRGTLDLIQLAHQRPCSTGGDSSCPMTSRGSLRSRWHTVSACVRRSGLAECRRKRSSRRSWVGCPCRGRMSNSDGPRPRLGPVATLSATADGGAPRDHHGSGRAGLVAFAAVPMLMLVCAGRGPRPARVHVGLDPSPGRCVEGEDVVLDIWVRCDMPVGWLRLEFRPGPGMVMARDAAPVTALQARECGARWRVAPRRWGRWTAGTLSVVVRDAGGLRQATSSCPIGDLIVYPLPAPLTRLVAPTHLPVRTGQHVSRTVGPGVQFAGIRDYVWGHAA